MNPDLANLPGPVGTAVGLVVGLVWLRNYIGQEATRQLVPISAENEALKTQKATLRTAITDASAAVLDALDALPDTKACDGARDHLKRARNILIGTVGS